MKSYVYEEYVYESALSSHIHDFIQEKRSLGYLYNKEAETMKSFDRFWFDQGYGIVGMTPDNISGWTSRKDSEGANTLKRRIATIRQFSLYLNGTGIPSFIPHQISHVDIKVRRPLSKQEISELFHEIDSYTPIRNRNAANIRLSMEYPVIFRLLYLCGLRLREACYLAPDQLNLQDGIITIINGKGNKDRLVYVAEDMASLLKEYMDYMQSAIGNLPTWLFPGECPEKPIYPGSVEHQFNEAWQKTTFANTNLDKPVVHDLRHTFVVDRINLWMKQGLDFDQMLPYLSKYLGHKTFNETYYYYHYTEEAAKIVKQYDSTIKHVIPEVLRR